MKKFKITEDNGVYRAKLGYSDLYVCPIGDTGDWDWWEMTGDGIFDEGYVTARGPREALLAAMRLVVSVAEDRATMLREALDKITGSKQ